jgi:BirA family biotin operon repressor/biotin-[acetyl-CoA-carboxylase] ligase
LAAHACFELASIAAALGPLAGRFDIDVLAECDSTNARLIARAEAGAPSGLVIVAERQTAGRGRMGRTWFSAAGDSLTFSLLWRLPAGRPIDGLSLAVGVAIADALVASGVQKVALKWPNDILLGGRKLGGVLIELAASAAVIGIGLNLRLPADMPPELAPAAAALGQPVAVNELLAKLLAELHRALATFASGGFVALHGRWQGLNAYAGAEVQVLSPFAPPLIGRCRGVADDGALLLETGRGIERVISGDVSLRRA